MSPGAAAAPRVAILDDDPTGSQAAGGVKIALRPPNGLETLFDERRAAFVLTNTRALRVAAATALVTEVITRLRASYGPELVIVQRGDSTLRGHIVEEMRVQGLDQKVGLFVPAFPAAGRLTLHSAHYLELGGRLINVADSEFAQDPVFEFTARTILELLANRDPGRLAVAVRPGGDYVASVAEALVTAAPGTIVVPDVATDDHIAGIAQAFWQAQAQRAEIVVRCAAPLAVAIGNCAGTAVQVPPVTGPVLLICGSHTQAATRQLAQLGADVPRISLSANQDHDDLVAQATAGLSGGLAIIMTERVRSVDHGSLAVGAAVMARLIAVVRDTVARVPPAAVISKGGITSAEMARSALGAESAEVQGPIETGISLWSLQLGSQTLPYVVVPGNIGDDGVLVRIHQALTGGTA